MLKRYSNGLLVITAYAMIILSCSSQNDRAAKDLAGTWENALSNRGRTTLTFDGNNLTGVYTTYEDDAGTTPITATTWTGIISDAGDSNLAGVRKYNISYKSFTAKALTESGAAYFNSVTFGGYTDWAPNAEKDIMGKDCLGFTLQKDAVSLDIYKKDGNTVSFGKDMKYAASNALAESDRPTAFDPVRVFTKK